MRCCCCCLSAAVLRFYLLVAREELLVLLRLRVVRVGHIVLQLRELLLPILDRLLRLDQRPLVLGNLGIVRLDARQQHLALLIVGHLRAV